MAAPSIKDLLAFIARLDALRADQHPDDLSNALRAAFEERELYDTYFSLLVEAAGRVKVLLEVFDKALTAAAFDFAIFKQFRQLCDRTGLLPTSHAVPNRSIQWTDRLHADGRPDNTWDGIYNDKLVAVKVLHVRGEDVQETKKAFCKEVAIWKWTPTHPNIVPLMGILESTASLRIVSEWMPNGNVRDYVSKSPKASRLQLLLDISRGLSFLHSLEIVHGYLNGNNVLVDGFGCARLGGFGFTHVADETWSEQWMAPELSSSNKGKYGLSTYKSDSFALGVVTFEVFTGVPMKKIKAGEQLLRPSEGKELGLSDELWELVQSSLTHEVEKRPPVSAFLDFLEKATPNISVLRELVEFDVNSEDDIKKLRHMFEHEDNTLLGMREGETLMVIEIFDRLLNSSLSDLTLRNRCFRGLQQVSARRGLLPKSYWIPYSRLVEPNGASSTAGRVPSIPQRLIDGRLVTVKTVSPPRPKDLNTIRRKLYTNGVIWKRLRHPNVVGFIGFGSGSPAFTIVYPWMSNGNLSKYVRDHPDVNKLALLLDIVRGLIYLHENDLVHGNLTGDNTLVSGDGVACISEYGLEIAINGWTIPKSKDVHSFGSVAFEVLAGTTQGEIDWRIMERVTMGLRPDWPSNNPSQGLSDGLGGLIELCRSPTLEERPTLLDVQRALQPENGHLRAQMLIDAMDGARVLRNHASMPQAEQLKLLNHLCKKCSRQRLLPTSMLIPDRSWEPMGEDRYGGQTTVSRCTYKGRQVAVKAPYLYLTSDFDAILSRFCREAVAWKHLQHPNILPLLGVTLAERRFAMVSKWMEDGNINEFIQKNPDANRTKLLADVAKGLAYMHGLHLAHGDLKGANILIRRGRRACISDFGLSTITRVESHTAAAASRFSLLSNETVMSFTPGGTVRWMSPEFLDPERFGILGSEGGRPTRESDCYALGMVIYEVLCGHAPYHNISSNERAILAIMEGVRPKKPENARHLGFTEALWDTLTRCWLEDWRARPGVEDILSCLDRPPPYRPTRRGLAPR